jgi:hypothetical protein
MDGADPAQWAEAIAPCLNAEDRRRVGEGGRAFAMRHFHSDVVAAALKDKFGEMLQAPPRRLADSIDMTAGDEQAVFCTGARRRAKSGAILRNRHMTSMQDAIHHVSSTGSRLDTVVHVGAGICAEMEDYIRMGARHVLLIEGLAGKAEKLRALENMDGTITVMQAIVSAANGSHAAHVIRNSREDAQTTDAELCLLLPTRLLEIKTALRLEATLDLTTISLADACHATNLESPENLLVLEANGNEAPTLEAAGVEFLQRFKWIAMRLSDVPLYESGTTREQVERIMSNAGFEVIPSPPDYSEVAQSALFRRYKSLTGRIEHGT